MNVCEILSYSEILTHAQILHNFKKDCLSILHSIRYAIYDAIGTNGLVKITYN